MGQISYGSVPQYPNNNGSGFEYFALRDDGDEALVRIMHDDTSSFEIVAVHPYQINGKFRNVNCIRDPKEDIEKCPLCSEQIPLRYRFYVHMIEYSKDANGNIISTPKVWERSLQFADVIASYATEYRPLSDYLFKIKRCGKKGSTDTTYNVIPVNMSVYRSDLYPKSNFFDNFTVIGNLVYNTDYNGMQKLIYSDNPQSYEPKPASVDAPVNQGPAQSYVYSPVSSDVSPNIADNRVSPSYEDNAIAPQRTFAQPPSTPAAPVSYQHAPSQPVPSQPANMYSQPSAEFIRPRRYSQQ